MNSAARKRLAWVAAVIAIVVISGAILIRFNGMTNSQVQSETTTSISSSSLSQSKASSTSTYASASSSNPAGQTPALLGFSLSGLSSAYVAPSSYQSYSEHFVTPNVKMNYTVVVTQLDTDVGHVVLSATSTVPGVTVALNPTEFTFLGGQEAVSLQISVAPTVSSPVVPIGIIGTTPNGVSNSTFNFSLEKGLIVVSPGASGIVRPTTLHIGVGQTVKWLDLVEIDDDGNGYVNITPADGSKASPTMQQYDLWSFTLDKPGTYTYHVSALSYVSSSVTIVVS